MKIHSLIAIRWTKVAVYMLSATVWSGKAKSTVGSSYSSERNICTSNEDSLIAVNACMHVLISCWSAIAHVHMVVDATVC